MPKSTSLVANRRWAASAGSALVLTMAACSSTQQPSTTTSVEPAPASTTAAISSAPTKVATQGKAPGALIEPRAGQKATTS